MEHTKQYPQLTKLPPTRLVSVNGESERAFRANSAFFRTKMSHDATTTGHNTDAVTDAADPNVWASTLVEAAHGDDHDGVHEVRTGNTSMRTDSHVTSASREEMVSFIQLEVRAAVNSTQEKENEEHVQKPCRGEHLRRLCHMLLCNYRRN